MYDFDLCDFKSTSTFIYILYTLSLFPSLFQLHGLHFLPRSIVSDPPGAPSKGIVGHPRRACQGTTCWCSKSKWDRKHLYEDGESSSYSLPIDTHTFPLPGLSVFLQNSGSKQWCLRLRKAPVNSTSGGIMKRLKPQEKQRWANMQKSNPCNQRPNDATCHLKEKHHLLQFLRGLHLPSSHAIPRPFIRIGRWQRAMSGCLVSDICIWEGPLTSDIYIYRVTPTLIYLIRLYNHPKLKSSSPSHQELPRTPRRSWISRMLRRLSSAVAMVSRIGEWTGREGNAMPTKPWNRTYVT